MAATENQHILTMGSRNNPGIVLLHGFLGSSDEWHPVASKLENRYYCIIPDLPGHGQTPASGGSFERQMLLLFQSIETMQTSPLFLAGYSMGGRIALYLALRYPRQFRKAVIISGSPGLRTEKERLERRQNDERLAVRIEAYFDAFLEAWYDMPLFAELKGLPSYPSVLAARKKNLPGHLAMSLRTLGTGNQPSLWKELEKCPVPLDFFAGEKDGKYVEIGRQMVNLCNNCRLDIFPQCGHSLHLENRELFMDRLLFSLTREQNSL